MALATRGTMWLRRIFYGIALASTPSAVAANGLSGIILGVSVLYFYTLPYLENIWKMVAAVAINTTKTQC